MGAPPPPSRGSGKVHWGLPRARPSWQVRQEIELEMAGRNERAARGGWGWQEGSRLCSRNFMVFMLWLHRELFSAPLRVRTSSEGRLEVPALATTPTRAWKSPAQDRDREGGKQRRGAGGGDPRGHTAVTSQDVSSQHRSESPWERLGCVVTSWSMWTKRDRPGP